MAASRAAMARLASPLNSSLRLFSCTGYYPASSPLRLLRAISSVAPLRRLPCVSIPGGLSVARFSTQATTSSLRDQNPNWSNRPPKETILLDGCDFEHWLVVVDPPPGPAGSPDTPRDEIIDGYIKTLAKVVGSEDEARMKIYSVSTRHYFAFGALVSEELSYKLKELPNVRWVLPDSYLNVREKDYGGEPFIDGKAVPYDPKYHEEWVRNNARANERSRRNDRPRNFDRSRNFERRRENMQNFQNRDAPPVSNYQQFQNQDGGNQGPRPQGPPMSNPLNGPPDSTQRTSSDGFSSNPPNSGDGYRSGPPRNSGDGYHGGPPPNSSDGYRSGPPPTSGDGYRASLPPNAGDGYRSGPPPNAGDGHRGVQPPNASDGYRGVLPPNAGPGYHNYPQGGPGYPAPNPGYQGGNPGGYQNNQGHAYPPPGNNMGYAYQVPPNQGGNYSPYQGQAPSQFNPSAAPPPPPPPYQEGAGRPHQPYPGTPVQNGSNPNFQGGGNGGPYNNFQHGGPPPSEPREFPGRDGQ